MTDRFRSLARGLVVLGVPLLVACGSAATSTPTPSPTPTPEPSPTSPAVSEPFPMGSLAPVDSSESELIDLRAILASSDLVVGQENRVVFALIDPDNQPLRVPEVELIISFLEGPNQIPKARGEAKARFRTWPAGPGGVYTAQLTFGQPGLWNLEVRATDESGRTRVGFTTPFEVKEESDTVALGAPAPRSVQRTARDVTDLAEITTAIPPDPDLYQLTIAEALDTGLPLVVTFATPAFCTTATCGPQVEVVSDIKEKYGGRVNFVHVEVFANPLEMQGDPTKGILNPVVEEWGLRTEPWTFVIDAEGRVAARFEAFVSEEELQPAIDRVLQ